MLPAARAGLTSGIGTATAAGDSITFVTCLQGQAGHTPSTQTSPWITALVSALTSLHFTSTKRLCPVSHWSRFIMNTEGDTALGWLGTSSGVAVMVVSQLPIYSVALGPTIQLPLEAAAGKQLPKNPEWQENTPGTSPTCRLEPRSPSRHKIRTGTVV